MTTRPFSWSAHSRESRLAALARTSADFGRAEFRPGRRKGDARRRGHAAGSRRRRDGSRGIEAEPRGERQRPRLAVAGVAEAVRSLPGVAPAGLLALGRERRLLAHDRTDVLRPGAVRQSLVILADGAIGVAARLLDGGGLREERAGFRPPKPARIGRAVGGLDCARLLRP